MTDPGCQFYTPFLIDSLNEFLGHPASHIKYGRQKKKLWKALDNSHLKIPTFTQVRLTFTPYIAGSTGAQAYDCINFALTVKAIEDWLVSRERLKNDTGRYVVGVGIECVRHVREIRQYDITDSGMLVDIQPQGNDG